MLVRVIDPVSVKNIMGHAALATTERYLHAVRATRLADEEGVRPLVAAGATTAA